MDKTINTLIGIGLGVSVISGIGLVLTIFKIVSLPKELLIVGAVVGGIIGYNSNKSFT